jgi:septum formation inhibitor-activating ATPase MinD
LAAFFLPSAQKAFATDLQQKSVAFLVRSLSGSFQNIVADHKIEIPRGLKLGVTCHLHDIQFT